MPNIDCLLVFRKDIICHYDVVPCVNTNEMNSVLVRVARCQRALTPEAGPALSDQQNPANSGLLENNPIDLFCLEYKSGDAVCGCVARLLESAYTTAMNMNQCRCRTDSIPADPGAKEALASRSASSRSAHLINCHSFAIESQLLKLSGFGTEPRRRRFQSIS